uniref:Uncharacterized protein n=1 Tax=Anopheles culicifacies TaxID=139723 RepID=A0A182MMM0_9DIPT
MLKVNRICLCPPGWHQLKTGQRMDKIVLMVMIALLAAAQVPKMKMHAKKTLSMMTVMMMMMMLLVVVLFGNEAVEWSKNPWRSHLHMQHPSIALQNICAGYQNTFRIGVGQ